MLIAEFFEEYFCSIRDININLMTVKMRILLMLSNWWVFGLKIVD
jgi:hypothetical protein